MSRTILGAILLALVLSGCFALGALEFVGSGEYSVALANVASDHLEVTQSITVAYEPLTIAVNEEQTEYMLASKRNLLS
jgi:hypothetical protein